MDVNFPINLSNASTTNFEDNLNGSLLGNLTICDECCQYTEEYDKNQTGTFQVHYPFYTKEGCNRGRGLSAPF